MTITAEKQLGTPATPSRPSSAGAGRARVRSDVTLAARVIPTHYPLETFIAVNPLAGLEGMPFEQAVRRAGDLYGTAGTVGEAAFRQMHRQGRITDADLDSVLARRYPNLTAESTLRIGGRTISPVELLRADLLHGASGGLSPDGAARHVATRSSDWAQVYPEWGLAGNAAFIVAPRSVTQGIDLQRRTFLHSYEADVDPEGSALETILTAPLVVAQWINSQYYFSTVAPEVFGAGTKTIHNVVGKAGVIAGHSGDLQLGLPWQSVSDGTRLIHEPLRLLAVVQAPIQRIDEIVDRNPILQHLFGNDWIALAARENPEEPWRRWTRNGWRPWSQSDCAITEYTSNNNQKEETAR